MIALQFSGYFQCRLATDPDPADEPRGVSGFQWAVAGEDNFDRIIRLHDPVNPRIEKPPVGVFVRRVVLDGAEQPGHPLAGARVDLLDDPKYEGRNGIVARSGFEPIVPFHIKISQPGQGFVVQRESGITDPPYTDPPRPGLQATAQIYGSPGIIGAATGVWDFGSVLRARGEELAHRRAELKCDHPTAETATACAALGSRLACLNETARFAAVMHGFRLIYSFSLTGPGFFEDEEHRLDRPIETKVPWQIEFWMGAWDIDAMTGFMEGWLIVPQTEGGGTPAKPALAGAPGAVQPLEFTIVKDERMT
jgi:hypothetical protein